MKKFLKTTPIPAISTDAIRHLLKQLLKAEDYPDLFAQKPLEQLSHEARAKLQKIDEERYIRLQNLESSAVWPAALSYLESHRKEGISAFVEGVAVLPHYVAALSGNVRAVFIGNQSAEHWGDMLAHADRYTTDGLNALQMNSNEEVKGLSRLYRAYSVMLESEAKKYDFPYIEMSEGSFSENIERVVTTLRQP